MRWRLWKGSLRMDPKLHFSEEETKVGPRRGRETLHTVGAQ